MAKKTYFTILVIGLSIFGFLTVSLASRHTSIPSFREWYSIIRQMPEEKRAELEKTIKEKQPEAEKRFAQKLKETEKLPQEVIARVNGVDVFFSDFARHKAFLEKQSENPIIPFEVTNEMVIKKIIEEKAIFAEAKKRNLLPKNEEIEKCVAWQKSLANECFNDKGNKEQLDFNKKIWQAYLDGLEISEEEFWVNLAPKEYAKGLVILKLRNEVISKVPSEGSSQVEYQQKQEEAWEKYLAKLVSQARVEVIKPELFNY